MSILLFEWLFAHFVCLSTAFAALGYLQANTWSFLALFFNRYQYVLGIEDLMNITDFSEQWHLAILFTAKYCINESIANLHPLVIIFPAFS